MKELSLLMFFIALIFGLTVFVSSLFRSKNPDDSAFYIPSRGLFNIIWGSIFYIGYGMLMFPQPLITFTLGLINGVLIFYALCQKFSAETAAQGRRFYLPLPAKTA